MTNQDPTERVRAFYRQYAPRIDLTPAMLTLARDRARELGVAVVLVVADAQELPFAAASFDSVVCTLGLNAIPDDRAAVAEMYRVLRLGGRLVLLGHVASPYRVVRAIQRVIERWMLRRQSEPTLIATQGGRLSGWPSCGHIGPYG
jgi:ubiquinone/menaquinone biosynthesis C-methylase UbiE